MRRGPLRIREQVSKLGNDREMQRNLTQEAVALVGLSDRPALLFAVRDEGDAVVAGLEEPAERRDVERVANGACAVGGDASDDGSAVDDDAHERIAVLVVVVDGRVAGWNKGGVELAELLARQQRVAPLPMAAEGKHPDRSDEPAASERVRHFHGSTDDARGAAGKLVVFVAAVERAGLEKARVAESVEERFRSVQRGSLGPALPAKEPGDGLGARDAITRNVLKELPVAVGQFDASRHHQTS